MNMVPHLPTRPGSVEVYAVSEAGHAAGQAVVAAIGAGAEVAFHSGTLATAARLAGMTPFAETVLLEIEAAHDVGHLAALRALAEGGVSPVLLGPPCDISTYRKLIAGGARDYLELPLAGGIDLAFLNRRPVVVEAQPVAKGRVIAVSGVCGGTGASVLSSNLAAVFASAALNAVPPAKAALIDADLLFGSLPVDLGAEQTRGYLDALAEPSRVDMTYLDATTTEPFAGLALYSTELSDLDQLPRLNAGLPDLLGAFGANFATTVVDLPRALLFAAPGRLAEQIDDLILVQAPGFGAVRALGRLVEAVRARNSRVRIHVVLSHLRQDAQLTIAEIASAASLPVVAELPYAMRDIARAHLKGEPVVRIAAQSRYSKAVLALKAHLDQVDAPKSVGARKGLFGRIFR